MRSLSKQIIENIIGSWGFDINVYLRCEGLAFATNCTDEEETIIKRYHQETFKGWFTLATEATEEES